MRRRCGKIDPVVNLRVHVWMRHPKWSCVAGYDSALRLVCVARFDALGCNVCLLHRIDIYIGLACVADLFHDDVAVHWIGLRCGLISALFLLDAGFAGFHDCLPSVTLRLQFAEPQNCDMGLACCVCFHYIC